MTKLLLKFFGIIFTLTLSWNALSQGNQDNFAQINYLKSEDLDKSNWSQKVLEYVISIKDVHLWNYLVTDVEYTSRLLKQQKNFLFPKIAKHSETLDSFNKMTIQKGLFLNHGTLLNIFSMLYLSNPFDFGLNLNASRQANAMTTLFDYMNPSAVNIQSKDGDFITVELSLVNAFNEIFPNNQPQLEIQYEFLKQLSKGIEESRDKINLHSHDLGLLDNNIFKIKEKLIADIRFTGHKNILDQTFDYMMAFLGANIEPLGIGNAFHSYPITFLFRRILLGITNLDLIYQNSDIKDAQGRNYLFSMPQELRSKHFNTRTYHMWLSYGLTKLLISKGFNKIDALTAVQALGVLYEFLSPTTGRVKQALESSNVGRFYWMVRQTTASRLIATYKAAGFFTSDVSVDSLIELMFAKSEKMQNISYQIKVDADELEGKYYIDGAEETNTLNHDQLLRLYMNAKFKNGGTPFNLVKIKNNSISLNTKINPASWYCEVALGGLSEKLMKFKLSLQRKN